MEFAPWLTERLYCSPKSELRSDALPAITIYLFLGFEPITTAAP